MTRQIPVAKRPEIEGVFETAMSWISMLPGALGYIGRRKLKRRQSARMQDTFSEVLSDTHAGDLCIDLGANVGEITTRLAATGADVICFEPDPAAFSALEAATADLVNVTLENKAAGHKQDNLLLRRSAKWSPKDPLSRTTGSSLIDNDNGTSDQNSVLVEVVDIISYLEKLDRDIRILKMDIEGAEWEILTRLMDHSLISRIYCIFVETHERFDPAKFNPVFDDLQTRAEQLDRPYINLYWV